MRLLLVMVVLCLGCIEAVEDTPELLNEYDRCYELADGNKTIYDQCVKKVLDEKYPLEKQEGEHG